MRNQIKFPATLAINKAKLSSMHTDYGYGMKSKLYYIVKLAVPFNSRWINIEVWMAVEELKAMLKKSTSEKLGNIIEKELFEPRNKGFFAVREWFNRYLHCRGLELELIQVRYEELPAQRSNLYTTKQVIELLK